jgi:uncharacterized lipoprotein NlpE involved in copper resistance
LLEDGTYRLRRVYLEADEGEDRPLVEVGRWDTGGGDDRVVLRGRDEGPIHFEVEGAETLRFLDQQGQPIESEFDYTLRRLAEVDRIADVFPMRGEFSYMADAGWFSECRTRRRLLVAQEADNAALERAYAEVREQPGGPVLVIFEGCFAMRPPMEDHRRRFPRSLGRCPRRRGGRRHLRRLEAHRRLLAQARCPRPCRFGHRRPRLRHR